MTKRVLHSDEADFMFQDDNSKERIVHLNSGSLNCVHTLTVNGKTHILRVGLLPQVPYFEKQNAQILRGLEVVHVFQQFEKVLGPSLVKEIRPYTVQSKLSTETMFQLCAEIRETYKHILAAGNSVKFAVQHLEYATGGELNSSNMSVADVDFCAFSLIWFFRQTQHFFDFRHRDVKPQNIVLREATKKETFKFLYGPQIFTFESRLTPVVVDYDFASVLTTEDTEHRKIVGTYFTAPPHALIYQIIRESESSDPNRLQDDIAIASYDWWSLGITLFGLYLARKDVHNIALEQRMRYAKAILSNMMASQATEEDREEFKEILRAKRGILQELLRNLCFGAMIASIVHEDGNFYPPQPAQQNYPFAKAFFKDKAAADAISAVKQTYDYQHTVAEYAKFPPHAKNMLRALLSWSPSERMFPVEVHFTNKYGYDFPVKTETVHVYSNDFDRIEPYREAIRLEGVKAFAAALLCSREAVAKE